MSIFFLVLGIIIGFVGAICVNSNTKKKPNSEIEIIIAIVSLLVFGFYAYSRTITDPAQVASVSKYNEILISFFSSFIFSWILTKYSGDKQLIEREKSYAIKLFRSCINIKNNISYSIGVCGTLSENCVYCRNNKGAECEFSGNYKRIRDQLIIYRTNIDDLKNDLSDVLSEDINNYNTINGLDEKIHELESKIQDEDNKGDDITLYYIQLDDLKSQKKKLINNVDTRVKLIIQQEKPQDDEIKNYIEEEKRFHKARGIATPDIPIQNKAEFQEEHREKTDGNSSAIVKPKLESKQEFSLQQS